MKIRDFRCVFLPYCLKKQPDGRYAVLNRQHKPLGFVTYEHVFYEAYPILFKMRGLKPSVAAKLSFDGNANVDEIFLYNDGCVPTRKKKYMLKYLERLRTLAPMKLS